MPPVTALEPQDSHTPMDAVTYWAVYTARHPPDRYNAAHNGRTERRPATGHYCLSSKINPAYSRHGNSATGDQKVAYEYSESQEVSFAK